MSSLGTLTLDLIAEVGRFNQGLDQASRTADRRSEEIQKSLQKIDDRFESLAAGAKKLGAVLGVSLSAVALNGWVHGAMKAAASTAVFASRIDVSVESLTMMRYVAEQAGVAADTFDASMMRLTRRLGAAKNGGGPAIATLDRLGLSASHLLSLPLDKRLDVIGDAMKGLSTQAERLTAAQDLAGDSARQLVPMWMMQAEEVNNLKKEAEQLGYVYSQDMARSADAVLGQANKIKGAFGNLAISIAEDMLPTIEGALNKITSDDIESVLNGFKTGVEYAVTAGKVFAVLMAGRFASSLFTASVSFIAARIEAVKYQATLAKMAGVSRGASVAITTMGTSARIASLSMAALGGPVGILAIAASSMLVFGVSAKSAEVNIDQLDSKIYSLSQNLSKMTERQASSQKLSLNEDIRSLKEDLSELEEEFARAGVAVETLTDRLNSEKMSAAKFEAISKKVQEWKDEQTRLGGKIDDTTLSINNAEDAVKSLELHISGLSQSTDTATDEMVDKFNNFANKIKDEIGRIGLDSNIAVFEYELKNTDKYKDFDPNGPEIEALRLLHQQKDAKLESYRISQSLNRASSKKVDIEAEYKKIMESTLSTEERRGLELSKNLDILRQYGASEQDMLAVRRAAYESMYVSMPGMGEGGDTLTAQLARIGENMAQLDTWREEQLAKMELAYGNEEIALAESLERREELEKQYRERRSQFEGEMNQELMNLTQNMTSDSLSALREAGLESTAIGKATFFMNRGISASNTVISALAAGTKAMELLPGMPGVALGKSITAMGMINAGLILGTGLKGMAHSGIDKVPETGTWLLEKGERVVTANTSAKLDATLENLRKNSVVNNTGGDVYSNVYVTIGNNGEIESESGGDGKILGNLIKDKVVEVIAQQFKTGGIFAKG